MQKTSTILIDKKNQIAMSEENRVRNSMVEFLRIVAMCMIVADHFVLYNGSKITTFNDLLTIRVLRIVFRPVGSIGVAIFVVITVWYLAESPGSLEKSFKKIWILDRQLIFYSVIFSVVLPLLQGRPFCGKVVFLSLFPLFTSIWWFPSTYAILLLLMPFLITGLRALSRQQLQKLCILITFIFGIVRFIPHIALANHASSNMTDLLCLVILTAYIRWYIPLSTIRKYKLYLILSVLSGFMIIGLCSWVEKKNYWLVSSCGNVLYNGTAGYPACFVGLMIAIPLAMIAFSTRERYHFSVNVISSKMFGVYLISEYPLIRTLLWKNFFTFAHLSNFGLTNILSCVLVVIGVLAACATVDGIRSLIFRYTIDRYRYRLFDWVYSGVNHRIAKLFCYNTALEGINTKPL